MTRSTSLGVATLTDLIDVEPPSLETNAIRTPFADHVGVWIHCPQRAAAAGLTSVPSALIVQMLVEGGEVHGRGAIDVHLPQFLEATAVRNVEDARTVGGEGRCRVDRRTVGQLIETGSVDVLHVVVDRGTVIGAEFAGRALARL